MSEIRFWINDETYTSIDFDPATDYPVLADLIRNEPQFYVLESLDGIFEFYLDFIYKDRYFTFYWDDQMGSEIHFRDGGLADPEEKRLFSEIADLMCGRKAAGPPRD